MNYQVHSKSNNWKSKLFKSFRSEKIKGLKQDSQTKWLRPHITEGGEP